MSNKRVAVVVLGDVGRSPRIQYHSLSLAQEGFQVSLLGYEGSKPMNTLLENPNIQIKYLISCPNFNKYLPKLFSYVSKVIWQTITLFLALFMIKRTHHVLVQNPPTIPTIAVCWAYSLFVGANFIIDWHNYGHSIMALTLSSKHKLVSIAKWFEWHFGVKAHKNLCVTRAMQQNLLQYNIKSRVLYDRPAECFDSITLKEKHELLMKLARHYPSFSGALEDETAITRAISKDTIELNKVRPGIIISSTSWTEDEDFNMLLEAFDDYEKARDLNPHSFPLLICVITGKGPLKEYYQELIEKKKWNHINVLTPWLEIEDYPKLLASADLGVCLHTSSSGLDLPMKVVDMFGCGLPVCAYNFACLNELVVDQKNGYIFDNSKQLGVQIKNWFKEFPNNKVQQMIEQDFKIELKKFQSLRWHENWIENALPFFDCK